MRKALIVGIDNYLDSPLSGCVNDAYSFATIIETNADGSPNFDVKVLTNVSKKADLVNAIRELFESDNDVSLFYFSGHGFANTLSTTIVTPDFTTGDEGVPMDEILKIVNNSPAKEKIVILDCCHSGHFGSPGTRDAIETKISSGTTILTASLASGAALEENGVGVFTKLLISALQGGAASITGAITSGSVYAYIDLSLGAWSQRPVFKTNVSRFTSIRNVQPKIELSILRKITEYFNSPEEEIKLDPSFEFSSTEVDDGNVKIFKDLQKYVAQGLVAPVGAEHMYFAAMESKSCKLTALGSHYWSLVKKKKI